MRIPIRGEGGFHGGNGKENQDGQEQALVGFHYGTGGLTMANIKKKVNKGGTVWRVDYYDPDGRRVRKDFPRKKDAEA